jgi:hypothetical protein
MISHIAVMDLTSKFGCKNARAKWLWRGLEMQSPPHPEAARTLPKKAC